MIIYPQTNILLLRLGKMEVDCSFLSTSVLDSIWKSIKNRSRDFAEQDCSHILLGLAKMQFSSTVLDIETMKSIKERITHVKPSEFIIQV
jgi:hypothetical protein